MEKKIETESHLEQNIHSISSLNNLETTEIEEDDENNFALEYFDWKHFTCISFYYVVLVYIFFKRALL